MHDVLSIIMGGGAGTRLSPLTKYRSKPAVPIGGKYRLIDIPISNCLNSGLHRIFILTQFNSASLNQHIHHGYALDSFREGFVDIIAAEQTPDSMTWFQGTADAVRKSLKHIRPYHAREVLILSGDHIYHMDYTELIERHRDSKSQVTIAAIPVEESKAPELGIFKIDSEGTILDFHEKPKEKAVIDTLRLKKPIKGDNRPDWKLRPFLGSMGIYLFDFEVLEKALADGTKTDFGKEVIPAALRNFKVSAHVFNGYWEDIGTIRSFFEANLELAQSEPPFNLFDPHNRLFTRPRFLPITRLEQVTAQRTVISEGCILAGAELRDCLIGIRSFIGSGTRLQRVVMMGADDYETASDRERNRRLGRPDIGIGANCIIEEAIIDKNARVGNNVRIRRRSVGEVEDGDGWAVRDGIVCIEKNAVIGDGTVI